MSDTLYAATRKGLFTLEPANGSWRSRGLAFTGEPVTALLPDGRDGTLYAALNLGHFGIKLHRSDDDGRAGRSCPRRPSRRWRARKTGRASP